MTEIIKFTNAITSREAQIEQASQGKKIKKYIDENKELLRSKVSAVLLKANSNLGGAKLTEHSTDFQVLLNNTLSLLAENYLFIALDEFSAAVLYGSIGEYKKEQETLYLSLANINLWIKSYLEEDKKKAMTKINSLQLPEKSTITEAEKEKILMKGLVEKFEKFKKTGEFEDAGNASYNFLDKKGKLSFTVERKKQFMNEAEETIRKQKDWKNEVDFSKRNEFKTYLEALEKGQKKDDVVVLAKKIALRDFFASLVEMEMEITELFN